MCCELAGHIFSINQTPYQATLLNVRISRIYALIYLAITTGVDNDGHPKKPDDYVSVQKALQILLAFETQNRAMGTMEISALLEIHKSTVSRLLNVLTILTREEQ